MKWFVPVPHDGDLRVVSKFAWLPTRISRTEVVWLQRYVQHQVYIVGEYRSGARYEWWADISWSEWEEQEKG